MTEIIPLFCLFLLIAAVVIAVVVAVRQRVWVYWRKLLVLAFALVVFTVIANPPFRCEHYNRAGHLESSSINSYFITDAPGGDGVRASVAFDVLLMELATLSALGGIGWYILRKKTP